MPNWGSSTDHLSDAQILDAIEREGHKAGAARALGVTRNAFDYRFNKIQTHGGPTKRWIVTAAQNNTAVDGRLWASLQHCASHLDAEILVIPYRYRNPSAVTLVQGKEVEWWASEVIPYLCTRTVDLCASVKVSGDLKVQATAVRPLQGLEDMTQGQTMVVGHSQIAVQPVPRRTGERPIWLIASGAVTLPSYSETKAGKRAEFHHCPGAVVIETQGDDWWCWQLYGTKDGTFQLHEWEFTPKGRQSATPALALVTGDEHAIQMASSVRNATYGDGGIVETLCPETLVRHDVLDFLAESHHSTSADQYARARAGTDDVASELHRTVAMVADTTPSWACSKLIDSNHNRHLDRWLEREPVQPRNRKLWHQLKAAVMDAAESEEHVNAFEQWARMVGIDTARMVFMGPRDDLTIAGVDLTLHGDQGIGGSRGSALQFARAAHRCTIGHSHAPLIHHGVHQVGMSMDEPSYIGRLTKNDQCHSIIYANGKRTLLPIRRGKWRAAP